MKKLKPREVNSLAQGHSNEVAEPSRPLGLLITPLSCCELSKLKCNVPVFGMLEGHLPRKRTKGRIRKSLADRPDLLKERISSLRGEKWETAGGAPEEPYPLSPAPHRYPCVPGKALGNESLLLTHPQLPAWSHTCPSLPQG